MSTDHGSGAERSWLSNGSNPAQAVTATLPGESDLPVQRSDVPTPKERVAGLLAEYPDRMATPLSEQHGRKIRESLLDEPVEVSRTVEVGGSETVEVHETVSRDALPLVSAVVDLLEAYEGYRDKKLRMAKGYGEEQEDFLVDLGISFDPEYQSKTYAKISALERQFTGGEYPNGGSVEGAFEEPMSVLFGLTASSYNRSGSASSGLRPFVDHDRAIREAWSGDSSSVKRSLRYVLQGVLGLDSSEYAWWWQSEPHPGDGAAAGYSHSHPVVIFDASAASITADAIDAETFRPVVAKHVEQCEGAEWSGHDLDDAVTVNRPDEIDDFASYVSKYLAVGPDQDLLERSDEYLMWAASQWATSTQKYSKSDTATWAIDADKCEQRFLDPETEQDRQHGERVKQAPDYLRNRGVRWVCSECGSPHGIDQSEQSLARMRLDARETAETRSVVADGGEVVGRSGGVATDDDTPPQTLAERWPSASSVARVGGPVRDRECGHPDGSDQCPLCASETESPNHTVSGEVPIPDSVTAPPADEICESFEREPQWRPEAVVQAWSDDDEGTAIGSPGGTRFGRVVVEGHGSIRDRCGLDRLPPAYRFDGPEPWNNDIPFSESDVRAGRCPPPELVERERRELGMGTSTGLGAVRSVDVECPKCGHQFGAHPAAETVQCPMCDDVEFGRSSNTVYGSVTAKQWEVDWYSRRYSNADRLDDTPDALDSGQLEAIEELVRTEGELSAVEVCGRLMIDPSKVEAVADVI